MKQLIIGTDVLANATGGIEIQKKDANGEPVALGVADTVATAPEIRFVRTGNTTVGSEVDAVASPWIKGTDIIGYDGVSGVAQVAEVLTMTYTNDASGGNVTVKFIETSAGYEPFVRKSYEIDAASVGANLDAAIAADRPDFLVSHTANAATITAKTYVGSNDSLTNIQIAFDAQGTTAAATVSKASTKGEGEAIHLAKEEENLLGSGVGDYYRVQQADPSTRYVVAGALYDVYNLTWKNSAEGNIRGVDNLRHLKLAVPAGSSTWAQTTTFEADLDVYLATTPQAFVAGTVAL